jgi:hypothetical protein
MFLAWPLYHGTRGTARACVVEALYPARFALDSLQLETSSDDSGYKWAPLLSRPQPKYLI